MPDIVLILSGQYKDQKGCIVSHARRSLHENTFIVHLDQTQLEVEIDEQDLMIIGSTEDYSREIFNIERELTEPFEIIVEESHPNA